MKSTNSDRVKKSLAKYARPTITIDRTKNELYKNFVLSKGYQSLNDYFNSVLEYDMQYNTIPHKTKLKIPPLNQQK